MHSSSVVGRNKPLPNMYATKLLPLDTNVVVAQETPDVWLYQALKEVFQGDVFSP